MPAGGEAHAQLGGGERCSTSLQLVEQLALVAQQVQRVACDRVAALNTFTTHRGVARCGRLRARHERDGAP